MKELEFELRVRNNRLKERREALGMNRNQLATSARVRATEYGRLEAMKMSGRRLDGNWREIALALSAFHRVPPEELFPSAVEDVTNPVVTHKIDGDVLRGLTSDDQVRRLGRQCPDEAYDRVDLKRLMLRKLAVLTPREEQVMRLRFGIESRVGLRVGEHDLEEVAERFGVTRERVRQIEAKALRKLRHPSRSSTLRPFVYARGESREAH